MTTQDDATSGTTDDQFERPTTILVADDEHLVAMGMKNNLEELGYTVIGPASNGAEAMDLCREIQPDLALLDIQMPGMNGIEAANTIFNEINIPVVIISAYSDQDFVESSTEAGVFGYILKPLSRDQLRVGIDIAWSRYLDWIRQNEHIQQLNERLEQRKIIERAKWILVKRKEIEEPEAMKLLQKQARNNRKTLVEVASAIVESDDLLGD